MSSKTRNRLLESLRPKIDECVHCGFCLPTCPTYAETGRETESPRGRIYLIKALADGRIDPSEHILAPLDRCLDCRACETACPSGVQYGAILEGARAATESSRSRPPLERFLRWFAFEQILPHRKRLRAALRFGKLLRDAGTLDVLQHTGIESWLPPAARAALQLVPAGVDTRRTFADEMAKRGRDRDLQPILPLRGTVALLHGCIMDLTHTEVHRASASVLRANGFAVRPVPAQTCCGALHVHAGRPATARRLARANGLAFQSAAVDAVIVNASGCGAQLHEYPELLRGDDLSYATACWTSQVTADLAAFLDDRGLRPPPRPVRRIAVYDAPCHQFHAQRVTEAPLRLLRAIPGLELRELEESEWCCGSAGIYNLTQPAMADRLLDRKIAHLRASGADLVVTSNPGCQLQLQLGIHRHGLNIEVEHLATTLARAYLPPDGAAR